MEAAKHCAVGAPIIRIKKEVSTYVAPLTYERTYLAFDVIPVLCEILFLDSREN